MVLNLLEKEEMMVSILKEEIVADILEEEMLVSIKRSI